MSAPALFRQADIDRAVRSAVKNGCQVVIEGQRIRILPIEPGAPSSAPDLALEAEQQWDKALGLR